MGNFLCKIVFVTLSLKFTVLKILCPKINITDRKYASRIKKNLEKDLKELEIFNDKKTKKTPVYFRNNINLQGQRVSTLYIGS